MCFWLIFYKNQLFCIPKISLWIKFVFSKSEWIIYFCSHNGKYIQFHASHSQSYSPHFVAVAF